MHMRRSAPLLKTLSFSGPSEEPRGCCLCATTGTAAPCRYTAPAKSQGFSAPPAPLYLPLRHNVDGEAKSLPMNCNCGIGTVSSQELRRHAFLLNPSPPWRTMADTPNLPISTAVPHVGNFNHRSTICTRGVREELGRSPEGSDTAQSNLPGNTPERVSPIIGPTRCLGFTTRE